MQIVIDIPEDVYKRTVFYREFRDLSDCVATIKALEKAKPLPKDATNGDVIKAMFPNGKVIERDEATGYGQMIDDKYSYCSWFDGIWWNAPYKAESEVQE